MLIKNIKALSIVALLCICGNSYAQSVSFTIKDSYTQKEIENVNYIYGNQKGQSDKRGQINFTLAKDISLILSHISYEEAIITTKQLSSSTGNIIFLEPVSAQMLLPVTVYGLKGQTPKKTVKLNHADWAQHDAGQVLQQIPGFATIKKSAAFGFDPVFRGLKVEQLNILNDGALTSAAACPNRMDPPTSQIMINQVQQIEIMKGPHSFRYGPSMGGIVNFKTAPPEFSQENKIYGRINTGYETNGEVFRTEGMIGFKSKKIQVSTAGSYSAGNDYKDGRDSSMPSDFNRTALNMNIAFKPKENHMLLVNATRNFARNTDFAALGMDLLSDDTWLVQAGYKTTSKTKWFKHWNTQLFSSFVKHSMGNQLRPTSATTLMYTDANTQTSGGRTEITVQQKRTLLFFGADAKYETIQGNRIRKILTGTMAGKVFVDSVWQNSSNIRSGIFADLYQQTGMYKISLAARIDLVNAKAGTPSASFKNQYNVLSAFDFNPSISAGISRQFTSSWFAGLWFGRGVRSASITERYINSMTVGLDAYELLGNPQLKPEANNQADLSISFKKTKTSVELNSYISFISDYISSVITTIPPRVTSAPGVRQYINIKDVRLFGFELSWLQQWGSMLVQQLSTTYVYGENKTTGKPLPEMQPFEVRFKLEGEFINKKLIPGISIRYSGNQFRNATDFGERITSEFTTADMGVKIIPVNSLHISLEAQNITNKTYREHLARYTSAGKPLYAQGRSFAVMFVYSF
ncbi:MAG: TonB-dependent receptor [Lacibacter sp.]